MKVKHNNFKPDAFDDFFSSKRMQIDSGTRQIKREHWYNDNNNFK